MIVGSVAPAPSATEVPESAMSAASTVALPPFSSNTEPASLISTSASLRHCQDVALLAHQRRLFAIRVEEEVRAVLVGDDDAAVGLKRDEGILAVADHHLLVALLVGELDRMARWCLDDAMRRRRLARLGRRLVLRPPSARPRSGNRGIRLRTRSTPAFRPRARRNARREGTVAPRPARLNRAPRAPAPGSSRAAARPCCRPPCRCTCRSTCRHGA